MRVFICAFRDFSLAIPIDSVSLITLYQESARKAVVYNEENHNTYISLPLLLKHPQAIIHNGIILKDGEDTENNGIIENKNILLTTEIEYEIDIPDEKIHPIPKIFMRLRFSTAFKGIIFYSRQTHEENLTLLLNPEKLVRNIKRKLKA